MVFWFCSYGIFWSFVLFILSNSSLSHVLCPPFWLDQTWPTLLILSNNLSHTQFLHSEILPNWVCCSSARSKCDYHQEASALSIWRVQARTNLKQASSHSGFYFHCGFLVELLFVSFIGFCCLSCCCLKLLVCLVFPNVSTSMFFHFDWNPIVAGVVFIVLVFFG